MQLKVHSLSNDYIDVNTCTVHVYGFHCTLCFSLSACMISVNWLFAFSCSLNWSLVCSICEAIL